MKLRIFSATDYSYIMFQIALVSILFDIKYTLYLQPVPKIVIRLKIKQ
jgi:hypothetical protein